MTTKDHRMSVYKEAQTWWDNHDIIAQDQFMEEYYSAYIEFQIKNGREASLKENR